MEEILTVENLRELGASDSAISFFKETFRTRCTVQEFVKEVQRLKRVDLEVWILSHDPKLIEVAIRCGANVHVSNDYAIRTSSANGRAEVVDILIKHGANPCVKNSSALLWASMNWSPKTMKLLIEAGADIRVCSMKTKIYISFRRFLSPFGGWTYQGAQNLCEKSSLK